MPGFSGNSPPAVANTSLHLLEQYAARHTNHTLSALCPRQAESQPVICPMPSGVCCARRSTACPELLPSFGQSCGSNRSPFPVPADLARRRRPRPLLGFPAVLLCPRRCHHPRLDPAAAAGLPGRRARKGYTRLVSASARRASFVLTDSDASRRDIIRHLRIPAERIETILLADRNTVSPARPTTRSIAYEKNYALPPAPYLLYLGGFDVRKNVPGILQAFARLDTPHVKLVIAGKLPRQDTAFFPDPQRIARELGITIASTYRLGRRSRQTSRIRCARWPWFFLHSTRDLACRRWKPSRAARRPSSPTTAHCPRSRARERCAWTRAMWRP